jgi:hypothetical protein
VRERLELAEKPERREFAVRDASDFEYVYRAHVDAHGFSFAAPAVDNGHELPRCGAAFFGLRHANAMFAAGDPFRSRASQMLQSARANVRTFPPVRKVAALAFVAMLLASTEMSARADGPSYGRVRFRGGVEAEAVTPQTVTPTCANPNPSYFGGPIVQNPNIVAVFWNANVNATLRQNIAQFYADVTVSSYWSWLQEYGTVGVAPSGGQGSGDQAILAGSSGGAFTITPLQCPSTTTSSCRLTDAQLQQELARQINAGVLPAPAFDCTGNVATIYMVDLPPNINLGGPFGVGSSCVANGFCAYHNTATFGPNNVPLLYGAVMDTFTGPCDAGCGANATGLETATEVTSHELVETVTDPNVGFVNGSAYAFPAAWADNGTDCGELADICEGGGPGDTITVSGRTWTVQEIWSNRQRKCTSSGPSLPVCSGTTATGCRPCSCGDNGGACSGEAPVCQTVASKPDFGACETPAGTPAPASGDAAPVLAVLLVAAGAGALGNRRRYVRSKPAA